MCYGHATKCFDKQPTPGEAADLAFAISQIDPDSIYGYLIVGGFIEMYHQTEKEPKGMLFAHPLVDATQVHIPERWVEPCLFIPEEFK